MHTRQIVAGHYQLLDLIAQGGMGAVYLGRNLATGETVAVKVLRQDYSAGDPHIVERFTREGEVLRKLNHPNIVKIYAATRESGEHFLVMEYVSGGSLRDMLRVHPQLPVHRVLQIGVELADALARAHHLKIIHRDIKPANVLIADDGTPRLTDFGVARIAASEITGTGAVVGTYAYLAPEVFNGGPVTTRSDIWSFGVMLFEMLAGRRPFDETHPGTMMMAILKKPVLDLEAIRADAPIALVDLVYRMLEKDPTRRLPSARMIAAEMERILASLEDHLSPTRRRAPTPTSTTESNPAVRSSVFSLHNLPAQMTPFLGREEELEEIESMLNNPDIRLVTIIGPGGMGKTRLALEVAHLQTAVFTDGVYYVQLAALITPDLILPTIIETLSISSSSQLNPKIQLLNYLHDRAILLVMDNFEHLLAGAGIVSEILSSVPKVKVLATTRERLNLQGESLFWITGMGYPEETMQIELNKAAEEYASIKLFLQSARRSQPGYEPDPHDTPHISRICRLVQGLPLGIELAAGWVQVLSPAEIVQEIEKNVDFLETEMRDMPERHRSMRAVFDYSWKLLPEHDRAVFRKLAVFRGSFTREAAQKITGASLRSLTALVNKSLLHRNLSGRYEMHGLLMQYAQEKLEALPEELAETRKLHADYYADFMAETGKRSHGAITRPIIDELVSELGNIRKAWKWYIDNGDESGIDRMAYQYYSFYEVQGRYQEGEESLRLAISRFVPDPAKPATVAQARLVILLAALYKILSNYDEAMKLYKSGLAALTPPAQYVEALQALSGLGGLAYVRGDYQEAQHYYTQVVAAYAERKEPSETASALFRLGDIAAVQGDYQEAKRLLAESLKLWDEIGSQRGRGIALTVMGDVAYRLGEYDDAKRNFEESLAICEQLTDKRGIGIALVNLGRTCCVLGESETARHYVQRSLIIFQESRYRWGVSFALVHLGRVYHAMGQYDDAIAQYEASIQLCEEINNRWVMAFALYQMSRTEFKTEKRQLAKSTVLKALTIANTLKAVPLILECLVGLASSLSAENYHQQAAELASAVIKHQVTEYEARVTARTLLTLLGAVLSAEDLKAAKARGEEQSIEALVQRYLS